MHLAATRNSLHIVFFTKMKEDDITVFELFLSAGFYHFFAIKFCLGIEFFGILTRNLRKSNALYISIHLVYRTIVYDTIGTKIVDV